MIDYAKQSGITEKIDFTTNASLLTHETTNRLIAAGVERIHISIYGLSENQYYKVTSHKLNFSELIENIGYLYQNKKQCVITVKICDVAYETVQDEQKFYEIFSTICDSFSIEQIVPASYDVKYNDYIASKNIDIYGKTRVHKKICPPIFYSMSIHPDGSVSPCCPDWNKKLIVGNANTESLKKIWNGQNYYELQHNQLKDGRRSVPICARCEIPEFFMLDNIDEYREIILNRLEHVKMCSNNRSRNK
jgi:radical SAM protein with 4Fe4S-binding SPASM domain